MEGGKCPSCAGDGPVGAPCTTEVCLRRGLHYIPRDAAEAALTTAPHDLELATGTFIGEFLIIKRLGVGGFGRVLLGLQRPLFQLRAAVKVLVDKSRNTTARDTMLRAFENEARALALLRHPHVVAMLQYGMIATGPFLAMEYVPGSRTLGSVLDARRDRVGLRLSVAGPIMDRLMRGLEAAHKAGIIHRDLKPDNIMLEQVDGDPWHVKLVDFGLAKMFHQSQDTSNVLGTASYIAPEQLSGRGLGPWTDIYAVGLVAAEVVTGQPAFYGSQQEILQHKLDPDHDALALPSLERDAPAVAAWIRRASAWQPADRFQTVALARRAWNEAVAASTSSTGASAPVPPPSAPLDSAALVAAAPVKRSRIFPFVALAALVVGGGIATAVAMSSSPTTTPLTATPTTTAPDATAIVVTTRAPSSPDEAEPDVATTPDAPPVTTTSKNGPTTSPGACARFAGGWTLTTTVTRAKDNKVYAPGNYTLTVAPECQATLVKTGWGDVRFEPSALQTGVGELTPARRASGKSDAWELALRVTGGGHDFTMALVLRFGAELEGTWRHTGPSFDASGFEGTLVGRRAAP